jgi:hypothetical protein
VVYGAYIIGDRVYVRALDVFGTITGFDPDRGWIVRCEHPMPEYVWEGSCEDLQPAREVER